MKDLLLIDLDLTLLDTNQCGIYAYTRAFHMFNLPTPPTSTLKSYFGMHGAEMIHHLFPGLDDHEVKKVYDYVQKLMLSTALPYVKVFPGTKLALSKLTRQYSLGIISNAEHDRILAYLKVVGIKKDLFEVIIGNDDVDHGKPWPDEIFKAEHLTRKDAKYIVGDSIYDMKAAKSANVKGIGVLTGNTSAYKLKQAGAWKIISSIKDLPSLLL